MRKQYYFRPSSRGLLAWDVDRLVLLSSGLSRKRIPPSEIRELDEARAGEGEPPTWRAVVEHVKLMDEADLSFPIILSASGAVMDGRYRIAKAVREGRTCHPGGERVPSFHQEVVRVPLQVCHARRERPI